MPDEFSADALKAERTWSSVCKVPRKRRKAVELEFIIQQMDPEH